MKLTGPGRRSRTGADRFITSYKINIPCRPDGTPLPWMNYNAISFLEERLTKDLCLLEYGSGYSTPFFASFVKTVVSVECDR